MKLKYYLKRISSSLSLSKCNRALIIHLQLYVAKSARNGSCAYVGVMPWVNGLIFSVNFRLTLVLILLPFPRLEVLIMFLLIIKHVGVLGIYNSSINVNVIVLNIYSIIRTSKCGACKPF